MSYPQSSDTASDRSQESHNRDNHNGNGHVHSRERSETDQATPQGDQAVNHSEQGSSSHSPWWVLLGLLVLMGGGYGAWQVLSNRSGDQGDQQAQQQGPRATLVEVSEVDTARVEETSEFTGTLEADRGVGIQPQRPGEVQQILVQEGAQVEPGDALVQLGSTREQADIEAAQAQGDVSRAARESAAADLEALRAERAEADAELSLQREQIRRFQFLVEEGALAPEELDIRQRDLEVAQSNLNALERQIDAAAAGLEEADARLRQDQANLRRIREDLQDTTVMAPFGGTVGLIPIETGDYVNTGETLMNLVANDQLELTIEVPQERLDDLSPGLPVRIENSAGDQLAMGQINVIAPQVDSDTQLVSAKATFDNGDGALRDGQFVQATVVWDQRQDRIVVPQTAITYRGDRRFVYVAQSQEDQTVATRQFIDLGLEQGTRVEVIRGLSATDRIVTSGIQKLFDGAPIQPRSSSSQDQTDPNSTDSSATDPSGGE